MCPPQPSAACVWHAGHPGSVSVSGVYFTVTSLPTLPVALSMMLGCSPSMVKCVEPSTVSDLMSRSTGEGFRMTNENSLVRPMPTSSKL